MDTIKSSADISSIFSHAKRIHTSYLTLLVVPRQHGRSEDGNGRVAFIAGKKLGGAVWRNSAKRRMREICRALGGPWQGYDVVFLAKGRVTEAAYDDVLAACDAAVRHSELIGRSSYGEQAR